MISASYLPPLCCSVFLPEFVAFYLLPPSVCSFIFLPHAVHFWFWKNCSSPHLGLEHCTSRLLPQWSHLAPTKVIPPQCGHGILSGLPQPEHILCSFCIGLRHVGHVYPNGLLLPHVGQNLLSRSMNAPQWMHCCLYVAICPPPVSLFLPDNYSGCLVPHSPQKRIPG